MGLGGGGGGGIRAWLARLLVRGAARVIPGRRRAPWRREWLAEIDHEVGREGGDPGFALRAAWGAVTDALAVRREVRRETHDEGGTMGDGASAWMREIRLAGRGLLRAPGFALVAVLTLGLGMGGGTALFTLVDRVVLDPLPYPESDRLVQLRNVVPCVGPDVEWQMATAQFVFFGRESETLESIGAYQPFGVNVETPDGAVRARMTRVSHSFLELVGARPWIGRALAPDDDRPGGAPVTVVSHGFWTRALGADPEVVGRTLRVDGRTLEVVGVMAPGVDIPQAPGAPAGSRTDLWVPAGIDPDGPFYNNHVVPMVARLAPGSDVEAARAELARLTGRLPEAFPSVYSRGFVDECGFRAVAYDLKDHVVGDMARNLWVALGAVGLVLLIACANVANLFLVRTEDRTREMAVRSALGAGRWGLARHLAAESLLLAGAGGLVAMAVAAWGVPALARMAPDTLPRLSGVGLGLEGVLFTGALATAVAAALVALPLVRVRSMAEARPLAGGGRGASVSPGRVRTRSVLVVAQVALALTLLVGAGLLLDGVRRLQGLDPGIEARGALVADLFLAGERYAGEAGRWAFYSELLERIRGLPGVEAAGLGSEIPLSGGYGCTVQGFQDPEVRARIQEAETTTCAGQTIVTPGYFEALGISLLRGRTFAEADNDAPEAAAVVVSRAFAERFWPDSDALGRGVAPNGASGPWFRVVGVVDDVKAATVQGPDAVAVYYPVVRRPEYDGYWGRPGQLVVRVRGEASPTAVLGPVEEIVRAMDPSIPVANARTLAEVVDASMSRVTFMALLLQVAAVTALILAAVGLYGVLAYLVSRRTREIGMRLAIGAEPRAVVRMVVGRALRLTGMGLALGAVLAWVGGGLLDGLLDGVEAATPAVVAGAGAVLAAVALVAAWIPARRASRVDPATALRGE